MDLNIVPEAQTEATGINPAERVRRLLMSDEPFATTLLALALDRWGVECLAWSPQTLQRELEQTYGTDLPQLNFDKLMAAIMVLTTDLFFKDLPRFIVLANVLAGSEFEPGEFDPADAAECAWAITEALLINPPDEDEADTLFSSDIRHYIGFVLKEEGFVTPPDVLRIAAAGDFSNQVYDAAGDDPDLLIEIKTRHDEKTAEINSIVRASLIELLEQLRSLPVKEQGFTAEVAKRLAALAGR